MIRRTGLTLVEMMVTLAITAILAAAALHLLTGLARHANTLNAAVTELPKPHQATLSRLLEADLLQARRLRTIKNGFQLQTLCCLNPQTMDAEHRPVVISYKVQQLGRRKWLLRTQEADGLKPWSEKVICDVTSVDLKSSGGRRQSTPSENWGTLGDVLTVTLVIDEGTYSPIVIRRK